MRYREEELQELFADFQTCGDRQLEAMKAAAIQFCRDMASDNVPAYWLVLLGTSGAGKTMLLKKVAKFFRRHFESKLDETRSDHMKRWLRKGGTLEWVKCMDWMVNDRDYGFIRDASEDWYVGIDDIGAEHERFRELSTTKLFTILCARERKWTALTANLGVQDISAKMDLRIGSRLLRHGSQVIDVDVTDFNMRPYLQQ